VQANPVDTLGVLADPTRRRLFEALAAGPLPVGELAQQVPVTRPAVSQHLKVLKGAGLVLDRRQGTRRLYQVDPRGVAALRDYLDSFWGQALTAFQAHVDQQEEHRDV
jgi:DNA-binding transcriptional ArsR family regulator